MKFLKCLLIVILIASFSSCSKDLLGPEKPNTPIENFQVLWQDFDEHYGSFVPKGIDWKSVYSQYRPKISDTMSDASFFDVCKQMLNTLDDNHIYLRPTQETGLQWYSGGILGRTKVEDYDKAVSLSYLSSHVKYNSSIELGRFPDNIGYLKLLSFDQNIDTYHEAMDDVLDKLKDCKAIVIELRENSGGEDRVAQYIANRFASQRSLSFSVSLRNGPRHTDFSDPIQFFTKPEGKFRFTKPVAVLTNLTTFSSGETFVLAMLQNRNVKIVGDVTGGALSDAVKRELPNGWLYRLPIADVRDANGRNLEGIGIQPHIKIKNTKGDLQSGHDKVLEKALEILR
jgi:hypothetical protein